MITRYAHDPELFPSAQSQNHTPHLSRELTVPLVSLTPEDQITFSGISDTKPNDNSCRKPHDSFAEGSCPLLYHISQWPRRIRGTSSPPYNPLGRACLHPRGKPRGTRQSFVIEFEMNMTKNALIRGPKMNLAILGCNCSGVEARHFIVAILLICSCARLGGPSGFHCP